MQTHATSVPYMNESGVFWKTIVPAHNYYVVDGKYVAAVSKEDLLAMPTKRDTYLIDGSLLFVDTSLRKSCDVAILVEPSNIYDVCQANIRDDKEVTPYDRLFGECYVARATKHDCNLF